MSPSQILPRRATRVRLDHLLRLQRDGHLKRLKVDTDPASDTRPIEVHCTCGETHRVTVSPYRRRRAADEPFDLEVVSLDELRPSSD